LSGGSGNDGLFGGCDYQISDALSGDGGNDRFILCYPGNWTPDVMADCKSSDVQINLPPGPNWTDDEVRILDEAFADLQDHAGGKTKILKDPLCDSPLEFLKINQDPSISWNGLNQTWWDLGWRRTILIKDWNEQNASENESRRRTICHEVGHNWNTDNGNPFWSQFEALNKASTNINGYARAYGMTNEKEDWATCWEAYLGYTIPSNPSSLFQSKLKVVDDFFKMIGK